MPECGELIPVYEFSRQRRWRHLDTMQMKTELRAKIPRIACEKDGGVAWGQALMLPDSIWATQLSNDIRSNHAMAKNLQAKYDENCK